MVSTCSNPQSKADRACARSTIHSKHFKVSIHAEVGERNLPHHKFFQKAIDNCEISNNSVLEMIAVTICSDKKFRRLTWNIRSHASKATSRFVGLRLRPRIHPWYERELPHQNCALVDFYVASPHDTKIAVRQLLGLGIAQEREGEKSPNADHFFACALQPTNSVRL